MTSGNSKEGGEKSTGKQQPSYIYGMIHVFGKFDNEQALNAVAMRANPVRRRTK